MKKIYVKPVVMKRDNLIEVTQFIVSGGKNVA